MAHEFPRSFTYEIFLELIKPWVNDRSKWSIQERTIPINPKLLNEIMPKEPCQIFTLDQRAGKIFFTNLDNNKEIEITTENFSKIGEDLWGDHVYLRLARPPLKFFFFQPVVQEIMSGLKSKLEESAAEIETYMPKVVAMIIAEYAQNFQDLKEVIKGLKSQAIFVTPSTNRTVDDTKNSNEPSLQFLQPRY